MTVIHQRSFKERVDELIADGYLHRGPFRNSFFLSSKGLMVLIADVERPVDQARLTKESLEAEREASRIKETGE